MAEEEKEPKEVPNNRKRFYAGEAFPIIITAFIITLLTGGIAYGVQRVIGGGEGEVTEGVLVDGAREFRISALQWDFDPGVIRVNPGDRVRFVVTSRDIMHGFAINELNVNLPLSGGVEATQEVVIPPDIAEGTHTMYCSIFCGIGHPYMKGSVLIGERGFEIGKILPYIATSVMVGIFATYITIGRRRVR